MGSSTNRIFSAGSSLSPFHRFTSRSRVAASDATVQKFWTSTVYVSWFQTPPQNSSPIITLVFCAASSLNWQQYMVWRVNGPFSFALAIHFRSWKYFSSSSNDLNRDPEVVSPSTHAINNLFWISATSMFGHLGGHSSLLFSALRFPPPPFPFLLSPFTVLVGVSCRWLQRFQMKW